MTRMQSRLSLIALFVLALPAAFVQAQSSGNSRMSVTVTFGGGMNTATPPGVPSPPANHHVLPNLIEIKAGGAVNFAVAGFHQIVVCAQSTALRLLPHQQDTALAVLRHL